jgi:hypothetical protein
MIEMRQHAMLAAAAFAAVAGLMAWLAIRSLLDPLGRLQAHRQYPQRQRRYRRTAAPPQRRNRRTGAAFYELMAEREAAQSAICDSESLISNILERAPDAFVSCENTASSPSGMPPPSACSAGAAKKPSAATSPT